MKQLLRVAPVAVAVALIVPAMTPSPASASPVDQQRQRVEQIVDELERLEEQANDLAADYVEAIDRQTELGEEIVEAEASIAAKEAELEELRADLGSMAVRSFVGAGSTPLGPLFENSTNVNDGLQRDELARVALSAGDFTTDELDAFVADLETERDELADKKSESEQLAESLKSQQEQTERRTTEYREARADAEARLGQLLVEEEERRARESAARLQAEVDAAIQSNSAGSSNSGDSGNSGGSSNSGGSGNSGGSSNSGDSGNSGGSSSSGGSSNSGGGGGGTTNVPVSSLASVAVNAALGQQGVPYRYATSSPGVAFDCSGLTKFAWGQAGVYLPHQSRQQYASVPHVSQGTAQAGDLVFFYSPISHVGVYLGGGSMVHAPNTGDVVKVAGVNWGKVSGVGRPG